MRELVATAQGQMSEERQRWRMLFGKAQVDLQARSRRRAWEATDGWSFLDGVPFKLGRVVFRRRRTFRKGVGLCV